MILLFSALLAISTSIAAQAECLIMACGYLSYAFVAEEPAPDEAKRLISLAQSQKTFEGIKVIEALHYAEKLRPKTFKLAPFDFSYQNDGKLAGVKVCYWIGAKRAEGDAICNIGWNFSPDKKSLIQPDMTTSDGPATSALMTSRNNFLREIDNAYRDLCINPASRRKYC